MRIANDIEQKSRLLCGDGDLHQCLPGRRGCGRRLAFGFPNPLMLGALAVVLNYLPYIGPACMAVILLVVGLVTFPTLGYALAAAGLLRRR